MGFEKMTRGPMKSASSGKPTAMSQRPASRVSRKLRLPKLDSDQTTSLVRPSAEATARPIST